MAPYLLVSGLVDRRSVKRWTEENVSILFETKLFRKTTVPSSHSRSFRKSSFWKCSYRSCIAGQCSVTTGVYQVFYHVGNGKELRSIVRNGLVPGGFSTKTGRQAVCFTVVNPMDDEQGSRETFCDLSKARIEPYKNTWKPLQDTECWCNLMLAQGGGLQFYQTRSHAVILCDTLPAECSEKAICMKTKDQLHQRESARPRVVLRANWQCGLQDLPRQEARSSWETQSDAQSFWETGCNIADYKVPDISLSTVQQQDEQRQHTVAKLIEMFESHQHIEQSIEDVSQTQKTNRLSETSQKLLQYMDQTQIFDLCEIFAKLRCSRCNSFTEIGIIYCSCGRNLKTSRSPPQHFTGTTTISIRSLAT